MNGTKPNYFELGKLIPGYFEAPNPYQNPPKCNVNLLEMSRYARRQGKKLLELTQEEIDNFMTK